MDSLGQPQASDAATLERLFGSTDVVPLWIAEPSVPLAPAVVEAIEQRAGGHWYGYEVRDRELRDLFWKWNADRHGWDGDGTSTTYSPSIGTTIGAVIDLITEAGDGVILQPPVFTDFKPLIRRAKREPITNPLVLEDGVYGMDLDHLDEVASDPATKLMILCNPHNPVGRVWTRDELVAVGEICARNDVFVFSDEIHGDIVLGENPFVPFGSIDHDESLRWASGASPIKAFGLAGVADTFFISADAGINDGFRAMSSRLHLVRNNVFALAAMTAAYRDGAEWLDGFTTTISKRFDLLSDGLPDPIRLIEPEGTYLAWIDLRDLGLEVPELTRWLVDEARIALSPGHWFGRQGAGFARMTIAVPEDQLVEALERLKTAVGRS